METPIQPENTNENEMKTYTDPITGKFIKGNPGGGRPKGSISIITKIKQYYEEHPEEFERLCQDYREDPNMRKILWNYMDGMPKQSLELGGTLPFNIIIEKDGGSTTTKEG